MNLYMFYVGGNAGKSNIEVHDIQFVARAGYVLQLDRWDYAGGTMEA